MMKQNYIYDNDPMSQYLKHKNDLNLKRRLEEIKKGKSNLGKIIDAIRQEKRVHHEKSVLQKEKVKLNQRFDTLATKITEINNEQEKKQKTENEKQDKAKKEKERIEKERDAEEALTDKYKYKKKYKHVNKHPQNSQTIEKSNSSENILPYIIPNNFSFWKSKDHSIFGENLHMLKRIIEQSPFINAKKLDEEFVKDHKKTVNSIRKVKSHNKINGKSIIIPSNDWNSSTILHTEVSPERVKRVKELQEEAKRYSLRKLSPKKTDREAKEDEHNEKDKKEVNTLESQQPKQETTQEDGIIDKEELKQDETEKFDDNKDQVSGNQDSKIEKTESENHNQTQE